MIPWYLVVVLTISIVGTGFAIFGTANSKSFRHYNLGLLLGSINLFFFMVYLARYKALTTIELWAIIILTLTPMSIAWIRTLKKPMN